jgi:hypothetical protein
MKQQILQYKTGNFININKLLLLVCLLFICINGSCQQQALMAVGNLKGAPENMTFAELQSILRGEKQRWKDGEKVLIALIKTTTPLGKKISSKVFDMTGDELNKFWLALVFQGKAQAPKFFNSPDELEAFVAQNPGAIGIIDKPITDPETKFITIGGQKTF